MANKVDIPKSWRDIRTLEGKLDEALNVEERYWCQRAKVDWMKSGDRNSGFFHAKALTKKARNKMSGITNETGRLIESKYEIEKIIDDYFSKLFTSSNPRQEHTNTVLEGGSIEVDRANG